MSANMGDRAAWIKGSDASCTGAGTPPQRPWRFILLGAPGTGKGTQAELLHAQFGACPLSTGDVFRAAKACNCEGASPAIQDAMEYMRKGELVPDTTVINLVRERIKCLKCDHGFLLDGFPRTLEQARALDSIFAAQKIEFDAVINYDLPEDKVIERLGGRRTCSGCKKTFHLLYGPPKKEGICDACGASLFQREDDRPESIAVRLRAYHASTAPLIDFYTKKDLLLTVSAEGTPQQVFARSLVLLTELEAQPC